MARPGGLEGALALLEHGLGAIMVNILGGEHRDPTVAMLGVVPGEERAAEGGGRCDVREAIGKARMVLQGLELRLGEGIVVATPGAGSASV